MITEVMHLGSCRELVPCCVLSPRRPQAGGSCDLLRRTSILFGVVVAPLHLYYEASLLVQHMALLEGKAPGW